MFECKNCGGKLNKFDIPLNKKLISRETEEYFCEDCLCEKLKLSRIDLFNYAKEQKQHGCVLFDYPESEFEVIK